jgi:peptide/nickel transport system permease protein
MLTMIGKRLMFAIPSLIGVVIVTFLLTRALPGDPAAYFAGPAANKEAIEQIRKKLGFDRPLIEQFFRYTADLAHGDFGNSLTTGQPVATEIRNRLPASAELTLFGLVISIVIALPLGVLAATRPGSWIDHLCRVTTTAGVSLPVFFTGLVLVYIFYFRLGWSPAPLGRLDVFYSAPPAVTGFYLIDALVARDFETFRSAFSQLILPALTLAIFSLAPIAHDAGVDAGGAVVGFRAHRARQRPVARHRDRHLRLPQRHAAGDHHAEHGVLVPARRQRAG